MQGFFSKVGTSTFTIIFIHLTKILLAEDHHTPEVNLSVDFRTMHVWRGIATSHVPTLEPSVSFTKDSYSMGIWAAQSIDGSYSEMDIYFNYDFRDFSFTVYDYYCPTSFSGNDEFTDFNEYSTKHTLELNLTYHGSSGFPFQIMAATMVYGDDLNPDNNKNYYSTYLELGHQTKIYHTDIRLFLGVNAFNGYYGDRFGVVNTGLTATNYLSLPNDKKIPVQASFIANPMNNLYYVLFGFSL
ncbi:MAG: hypothetical protein V2I54_02450 [Bacteroidales bacterium]|jgi:hypothetical protein|nr:hypothetical protein [Bacteroidales bacterium]